MVPYIVNIVIILFTYFIFHALPIKKENKNKFFLITVFIEFFLILALREPISDMITYCEYYSVFGQMSWGELINFEWEKGYTFFNKILYMINPNERFFIVVTSALTLIGPYIFIKKYSKNYLMTSLMFVAMDFFGAYYYVLRQMLALSILLLSITFIKKRKFFKFLICVLIATLFHKSSILFLLGYFLFNLKVSNKYLIYAIFGMIIIFPLKDVIVRFIGSFIYQEYLGARTSSGYPLLLAMIFIYGIIYVFNVLKLTNKEDWIFYNQYIMAIYIEIFATSQSVIARLVVDYYISIIIILPNMIKNLEKKQRLLVKFITYLFIIILSIIESIDLPVYLINV